MQTSILTEKAYHNRGQEEGIKNHEENFGGDGYVDLVGDGFMVYTYVKTYQIVHLKHIPFIVVRLYLNEADFKVEVIDAFRGQNSGYPWLWVGKPEEGCRRGCLGSWWGSGHWL